MRQIFAIASTTVGEAIRRRVLLIFLFISILFLAIVPGFGVLSARSERAVMVGMLLGIIQLTSALIAIVLTVYLIPQEIERRTIYTILSKPVQRWQFLIGKYLGAVMALGLMMALLTIVMVMVFALQQGVYDFNALAELAKGPIMNFVQMSVLAAIGITFSTFVSPIVNFFLTGGLYLVGTLFNPFFDSLSKNAATQPVTRAIAGIFNSILPNFANYNVQNKIINPGPVIQESTYYITATLYGLAYIIGVLVVGILIFDKREV